jgi:hypothetical protein
MDLSEARRILGNQPASAIRAMVKALSLHSWNNTAAETQRLAAARFVLAAPKHRPDAAGAEPARRAR